MTVFCTFPDMVYTHVPDEVKKQMTEDQKEVFENLVVGVPVFDFDTYSGVAKAVLQIPKNQIMTITRNKFIKRFLNGKDFVDEYGELI